MEVYVSIYSEFHTFLTAYLVILKDLRLLVVWGKSNKNKTVYVIKKTRPHLKSLRQPNQNLVPKKTSILLFIAVTSYTNLQSICNQSCKSCNHLLHTLCIPRWNAMETVVSTSFQRGIQMVCLKGYE